MSPAHSNPDASTRGQGSTKSGWGAYVVIMVVFFGMACWFTFGPDMLDIPTSQPVSVDPALLSTAPRRVILTDPPTINIDGYDRTCMDCHKMFPLREDPSQPLLQHRDIVLHHGINKECRSCHDSKDRDLLVLRDGKNVRYNEVETLCAACHGSVYLDWKQGAHGRTNGYWDSSRGEVRRLRCTECHDPHNPRVPAMDSVAPLPGPNTLRMGKSDSDHRIDEAEHDDAPIRDPLRRAIRKHAVDKRSRTDADEQYDGHTQSETGVRQGTEKEHGA